MTTLSSRTQAGRALPLVIALVAALGLGLLLFGESLGILGGGDGTGGDGPGGIGEMAEGAADETIDAEAARLLESTRLQPLYGDGDLGAVRLRVLWTGSEKPVAGLALKLVAARGGKATETATDEAGVGEFRSVMPARAYQVVIDGEGFKAVHLQGISVRRSETTDLGDILVGKNTVLRGRVVDHRGRALPAANVTVHRGTAELKTDGIIFMMADLALNDRTSLEAAESDDEGYFAFSTLEDGVYRVRARRNGYATKEERDVVVQVKRSARALVLKLMDGAQMSGFVRDGDGAPIANARVTAFVDEGRRFSMQAPQREVTHTDESGHYVLDTLGRGVRYRYGVSAPGHAAVFDTGSRLAEGEQTRDFVLQAGGTLTGVVTAKDDGTPIAEARVAVTIGQFWDRSPKNTISTATATTDAEGRFRLEGVKPGAISAAQILAPGFVTASHSMMSGNQWPAITAGETTEVQSELERGGIVRGRVLSDETGKVVPGATVILDSGWGGFMQGTPSAQADENGEFQLIGVRKGEYGVIASADGFAPSDSKAARVTMDDSASTQTVDVRLTQAGVVKGTVTLPDGEPAVGVRVRVRPRRDPNAEEEQGGRRRRRGGSMAQRMLQSTRGIVDMTDAKGAFVLEGVAKGHWAIEAELPGSDLVRTEGKPFSIDVGEVHEAELTMQAGGTVSGRVLDEQGGPLAGARLQAGTLDPDDARARRLTGWTVGRHLDNDTIVTDASGRFHITGLEPGIILLRVEATDFVTWFRRDLRLDAGSVREGYTITMTRGAVIEGIVRGADGKPFRGAFVAASRAEDPRRDDGQVAEGEEVPAEVEPRLEARTGPDGRFRIENVPPGRHSVVVWWARGHKGYGQDSDENAIVRGVEAPNTEVEFRLAAQEPGAPQGR